MLYGVRRLVRRGGVYRFESEMGSDMSSEEKLIDRLTLGRGSL
jgi:hypothetical protein